MRRAQLGADLQHRVGCDAELDHLAPRLDICLGKVTAHPFRDVLYLRLSGTELDRAVAVPVLAADIDALAVLDLEHSDRNLPAFVGDARSEERRVGKACSSPCRSRR